MLDTDLPSSRDTTKTIQILARLSRFAIADVTDPRSAPHELQQIVPFAAVPTISVSRGQEPFSMAVDNEKYPWVLPARRYSNDVELHDDLDEVLAALERTRLDVRSRRRPDASGQLALGS